MENNQIRSKFLQFLEQSFENPTIIKRNYKLIKNQHHISAHTISGWITGHLPNYLEKEMNIPQNFYIPYLYVDFRNPMTKENIGKTTFIEYDLRNYKTYTPKKPQIKSCWNVCVRSENKIFAKTPNEYPLIYVGPHPDIK